MAGPTEKDNSNAFDDRYFNIDTRWEALCFDELNDIEKQKIRAAAKSDPLIRMAQEGFEPLGSSFEGQMVDSLLGQIQEEKSEANQEHKTSRVKQIIRRWTEKPSRGPWLAVAACAAFLMTMPYLGTYWPGAGSFDTACRCPSPKLSFPNRRAI